MRRHECCKASNNDEGGREEISMKTQTEVDGQSAELSETTPARPRARTEPRSMEKDNHGDRPRTGIRERRGGQGRAGEGRGGEGGEGRGGEGRGGEGRGGGRGEGEVEEKEKEKEKEKKK